MFFKRRDVILAGLAITFGHGRGLGQDVVVESASAKGIRAASKLFRRALARIESSLVSVETFGAKTPGAATPQLVSGRGSTGIVISPSGEILTSLFGLSGERELITVTSKDRERQSAKVLATDEARGIALLKTSSREGTPVEWSDLDSLEVGQWVVAVGRPIASEPPTVSVGILSALERFAGRAVQFDASANATNFGGPLLDLDGRVIGIIAPFQENGQTGAELYDSGIGFAAVSRQRADWLGRLQQGMSVQKARLGVVVSRTDDSVLQIRQVIPGSPAEAYGLRVGDKLIRVDGKPVIDRLRLSTLVSRHDAGDKVVVKLIRDQTELEIEIVL